MTSPPVVMGSLDLTKLEGHEMLYIRLHGVEGQPYLYGDPGWVTAISVKQIERLNLAGCEVFLEGCFGAQFAEAFKKAGALAVVGSDRPTFGKRYTLGPSSQVGRRYIDLRKQGEHPNEALMGATRLIKPEYQTGWRIYT